MSHALEDRLPLKRPEDALVHLVSAILGFEVMYPGHRTERAFQRQPLAIQIAIRKFWIFDHLPFYAAMVDLSMSEFERELAERFWADVEREAEQYKPRKRRQEATA